MPLQATSGAASYDAFGGGVPAVPNYIEDVFSTWLYTGNGSTQTITNGIDLAGKGGLVWLKPRTTDPSSNSHSWFDTARGAYNQIFSNLTNAQANFSDGVNSFGSTGFGVTAATGNGSGVSYASWTFRKQPKFFDVVTYTGDGVAGRQIAHSLGSAPGCIIVKCTNVARDWAVWHRTLADGTYLKLNTTDSVITNTSFQVFGDASGQTSSVFTVGKTGSGVNGLTNANSAGDTYVAYLFAHNAGGFGLTGTDNVISCGSFTTGQAVTLGYEPQWLLIKDAGAAGTDWYLLDNMRGLTADGTYEGYLRPNSSGAEATFGATALCKINATGFDAVGFGSGGPYIYIAIRRGPMKVPTDGTKVYQAQTYVGDSTDNRAIQTGIVTDLTWVMNRNDATGTADFDRLRGRPILRPAVTAAEDNSFNYISFATQSGFILPSATNYTNGGYDYVAQTFRRAPGFFDEVCYTGDGTDNRQVLHNLGVAPEMVIVKPRGLAWQWWVYHTGLGNTRQGIVLNVNAAKVTNTDAFSTDGSAFTSSYFLQSASSAAYPPNANGYTYVAYLFASCPGVSKVGSYTGTGTTQTINCGFTGGARFVLIKRTNSTGDWYVWDSARGIVAGNDPYLLLNSTAAEVTSTDYIDTASTGFEISSTAPAAINANGGTYIFLAIA